MKPARSATREYLIVLVVIAASSAIAWWATSATWAIGEQAMLGDSSGQYAEAVTQRSLGASALAPLAAAMPIVGFAGLAGVIGSRRLVRRIVGAIVVAAGVALVWTGIATTMRLAVGDTIPSAGVIVSVSPIYPIITALAGLALAIAGLLVVLRGRAWPTLGSNYERSTDRPADAWRAMDEGLDPTDDAFGRGAEGTSGYRA